MSSFTITAITITFTSIVSTDTIIVLAIAAASTFLLQWLYRPHTVGS